MTPEDREATDEILRLNFRWIEQEVRQTEARMREYKSVVVIDESGTVKTMSREDLEVLLHEKDAVIAELKNAMLNVMEGIASKLTEIDQDFRGGKYWESPRKPKSDPNLSRKNNMRRHR